VISRRLQRIATWLCLALTLFTGVVPARGMVLCLEADGCVSIEIKAGGRDCGGCDEHLDEQDATASEPIDDHDGTCPCVDFDVPGASAVPPLRGKTNALHVDGFALAPAAAAVPVRAPRFERGVCASLRPRPPDTLRLIRSVVLLR
jgi:hypothetical protein